MRAKEYENTSAKVCIRLFLFSWFRCIYICLYVFSHFMVPMYARSVYALISQRSSWKVVVTGEIKWGCNRARAKRYVRRATHDQVLRWHINLQDKQNEGQLSSGGQAGVLQFYFYTHPDPIFQWLNKNRFFQMSVQYCSRRCFVMVTCCIFCYVIATSIEKASISCTFSIFTGISWNRLCERSVKMETDH